MGCTCFSSQVPDRAVPQHVAAACQAKSGREGGRGKPRLLPCAAILGFFSRHVPPPRSQVKAMQERHGVTGEEPPAKQK